MPEGKIRLDQSVRNAIGIPYDPPKKTKYVLEIYPLKLKWFQRFKGYFSEIFLRFFGKRYIYLRVCKADVPDIEKNLARIKNDIFKILGIESGNKLVLETPFVEPGKSEYRKRSYSIRSFDLTDEITKERTKLEQEQPERFLNSEKVLQISPDIAPIFLDTYYRSRLGVEQLGIVKVRCDLRDIFLKELLGFGLMFFISSLTIVQIFHIKISFSIELALLFLLISMISFVTMYGRIRTRV